MAPSSTLARRSLAFLDPLTAIVAIERTHCALDQPSLMQSLQDWLILPKPWPKISR